MPRIQSILLSLILVSFSSLSLSADEASDSAPMEGESNTELVVEKDDNIMLRQVQPVIGFQALTVAGQEINATFLEEKLGKAHGAVVLLHDLGDEIDSSGVITPLRHQLLQHGWSTLTVSLDYPYTPKILLAIKPEPVPETDVSGATPSVPTPEDATTEPDASSDADAAKQDTNKKDEPAPLPPISNKQRIEAALEFLKAKGIERIVFLGHGQGGLLAINELSTMTTPFSALILVGTPALEKYDEFEKFNFPVLDVYGDQDLAGVPEAVNARKVVMKRNNNVRYTYREIIGANHVFYGLEPLLISTVRGWLYTTFVKQEENE